MLTMSRARVARPRVLVAWVTCLTLVALAAPLARAATTTGPPPARASMRHAPTTTGLPRFVPGGCVYTFAATVVERHTVQCGTVIVPESHAHPTNGKTIALPVAVYTALTPHPAPEPIVFLTGGPGQSGEAYARLLTDPFYHAYAAHNDLILFDERGTGVSVPSLKCPTNPHTTDPIAALLSCRDTLTKRGIDLRAYTDTENAADVNDIRAVLGYARINLEGGSYGSELGLAVLRDYAPVVRSAVLESIVPPTQDAFGEEVLSYDRAITAIGAQCAADAACHALNPDVRGSLQRATDYLTAHPLTLRTSTGAQHWGGATFSGHVFHYLYQAAVIPYLPDLLAKMAAGKTDALGRLVHAFTGGGQGSGGVRGSKAQREDSGEVNADGMTASIICSKAYWTPAERAHVLAAERQVLPAERAGEEQDALLWFSLCPQWPSHGADPHGAGAVTSSVPTLLVNGQFDPVTPPSYGQIVARTLRHSYFVVLPGGAHVNTVKPGPIGTCAAAIVVAFYANPGASPDTSCTARLHVAFQPIP